LSLSKVQDAKEIPIVVHGTYRRAWSTIQKEGLSKMSRNHIHFASGTFHDKTVISGTLFHSCRSSIPILYSSLSIPLYLFLYIYSSLSIPPYLFLPIIFLPIIFLSIIFLSIIFLPLWSTLLLLSPRRFFALPYTF
jgi:RNA 2'-phosphotransferase, Tpt1 / KptA family